MQFLIDLIDKIGIMGLILTMVLEGASVPFPGIIVILPLGYILNLNIMELFLVAAAMSLTYSMASYIPYVIGFKLERIIAGKYEKQMQVVERYFNKYGEFSIALLRPFAVGNYISYFAGMSKINRWKYILYTFIGIYPWSFIMLLIGRVTKGNIESGTQLIQSCIGYIYIPVILIIVVFIGSIIIRRILYCSRNSSKQNL